MSSLRRGGRGLRIADWERHRAESMGHRVRSQNPEFRRKTIKSEFLSITDYWLLDFWISDFGLQLVGIVFLYQSTQGIIDNYSKKSHPLAKGWDRTILIMVSVRKN
jgi:hypothetical protein